MSTKDEAGLSSSSMRPPPVEYMMLKNNWNCSGIWSSETEFMEVFIPTDIWTENAEGFSQGKANSTQHIEFLHLLEISVYVILRSVYG